MALTAPYPKVQGSKFYLGPMVSGETVLIVPGVAADYAAGGYVITALECGLSLIQQAFVTGGNATAYPASAGWYVETVFPETQMATNSQGFTGYSQFLFKVYVAATGVELAPAPAVSLNGAVWQVTVIGI